jgi:hypothetical protein
MIEQNRRMICEWRAPLLYPLATLISNLTLAITRTESHINVDSASRVYRWLDELKGLQRLNHRRVATEIMEALRVNLRVAKEHNLGESASDIVWRFPHQDAFRSLVDARMFIHVVQQLEPKLRILHWKAIIQGNLRPEDDRPNTPHRDYLLELYVASAAQAAGMNVELSEPDVVVYVAGQRLGIAAKRIKSRKQVLENAKKGARQIANAAVDGGLLFLDVSNIMNEHMMAMRYLGEFGTERSGTVHGHLMKFASEQASIQSLLSLPHVEGIILRHVAPAMLAKSFVPATLETWSPIVDDPSNLTIAVYGGMLDALSPPSNPAPGTGPSGQVPSEFSYAHP